LKERVGGENLIIIISISVRFYSEMLCTTNINTSNTKGTQTGVAER